MKLSFKFDEEDLEKMGELIHRQHLHHQSLLAVCKCISTHFDKKPFDEHEKNSPLLNNTKSKD